ncbi:putative wall-associated receptor kinase-like 11 [Pistacia vera]|uniref:putative wall-associated receptor kinase-like 11 n=1 Tax=Pistacia vera TaxID=55513 RepID=UPI001262DA6A|nr:putative wall-associated receptor kinase-like 11 [Pistacia vera]
MFLYLSCAGLSAALGTLSLSLGAQSLYNFVKRMIANKVKQIFFKKNGGSFLQQRMSSNNSIIEKPKFFTENELERATDSYNECRILGQGGQGTVYKGMLKEGRIIAVKRLKKVAERVDLFINEVEILSQIKHRNVVQFLGCCLDAEFPLLAYEFIPSGTLFQYIHDQNQEFPLTWDLRLRIATEVADALSYLHSATSSARIDHRDIKSSNILLDEKYRAKVSNVGTSRSIPVDVYSFGVVLAELLTGQEPIRSTDSKETEDLAAYFLPKMELERLFEILDARVSKDDREQEIMTFANLTRRCLDSNGSKRPTMREAATELAGIRTSNGASNPKQDPEEIDCVEIEITYEVEISSSHTESILESINSLCF